MARPVEPGARGRARKKRAAVPPKVLRGLLQAVRQHGRLDVPGALGDMNPGALDIAALHQAIQGTQPTPKILPFMPGQTDIVGAEHDLNPGSVGAESINAHLPAPTGPGAYTDPGEQEARTRNRVLAGGGTEAQAKGTVSRNARRYALMRLQQLQQGGISDEHGDVSAAATAALSSGDPAAAWNELSGRFMGAFKKSGATGDPRAWLQAQIAQRRAAAMAAAKQRLAEARDRRLGA